MMNTGREDEQTIVNRAQKILTTWHQNSQVTGGS